MYVYVIQIIVIIIIQNYKLFQYLLKKIKMKRHNNICLFMLMLYNKIKIEIDINNNKLLKTIWENIREIKGVGGGTYLPIIP